MKRYVLKRIGIASVVLFGITMIDFAIMRLAGNPLDIIAAKPRINKEMLAQKAANMGLDVPVWQQYLRWLKEVLHGNFGISYTTYQPVSEMLLSRMGSTLVLMGSALVISILIAACSGIYSALHHNRISDYLIVTLAFLGQSVPGFFLALIFIYLFTVRLGILPSGGMKNLGSRTFVDFRHMIMPVSILALQMAGQNIRYVRSAVLEILGKDYLRTARAKGIGYRNVIGKHALRNALIPIVTVIGMEIPMLFGGAVIVEQMFSWPGLGLLTMNAVVSRDYPVIMAVCLLSAVVVLLGNLLTDLVYALVDPSVSYR